MTVTFGSQQFAAHGLTGEAVLRQLAEMADEFAVGQIASTARSIAERSAEGRFYVACIGQFKRGKSTLLNALIGSVVLPTGVVPVTAVPTIIRHGRKLAARVSLRGAMWTQIPVNQVEEYVSEEKNPENRKGVAGVEIIVPSALLESGMCLVDTPGIGSVFAGNTAATQAFIPHIDAAIVVIGSDPPLSGDELKLVETIAQEVQELVFVLNKADRASDQERAEAVQFARKVLEAHLKPALPIIYAVSALEKLEQKGPERDWSKLQEALENLRRGSGRSLVRHATERGIRRAANQLLAVIKEELDALERPLEESESRITSLHKTLAESEQRVQDLGVLLGAEQQRLSGVLGERRKAFLHQAQLMAQSELTRRIATLTGGHYGPSYRRDVNQLAQEISGKLVLPWLEKETAFAGEGFRKTAKRFSELANEFLHQLGQTGVPGLESLPDDLAADLEMQDRSQFQFNMIERVAAPASPLLYLWDVGLGGLAIRGGMDRGAQEFLEELLEFNSSRVQSDVDQRLRESRKHLEAELQRVLREASAVAERALARAKAALADGASGTRAALARLESARRFLESVDH